MTTFHTHVRIWKEKEQIYMCWEFACWLDPNHLWYFLASFFAPSFSRVNAFASLSRMLLLKTIVSNLVLFFLRWLVGLFPRWRVKLPRVSWKVKSNAQKEEGEKEVEVVVVVRVLVIVGIGRGAKRTVPAFFSSSALFFCFSFSSSDDDDLQPRRKTALSEGLEEWTKHRKTTKSKHRVIIVASTTSLTFLTRMAYTKSQ